MKERAGIIEYLNECELQYPVDTWKHAGVDVWPVLKMLLFFTLQQEMQKKASTFQYYKSKILGKLKRELKGKFVKRQLPQKKEFNNTVDLLFVSASTYRMNFNNYSYSKLFDPILDTLESENSIQLEYHPINNYDILYKKERVIDYVDIYKSNGKSFNYTEIKISDCEGLGLLLSGYSENFDVPGTTIVNKLNQSISSILKHSATWKSILNTTQPKAVFLVCYYNEPMFGLVHACHAMNIPVVDMQHGGQGAFHPMYFFNKASITKLNLVPSHFWLWDKHYQAQMHQWLPASEQYRAVLGGNPWIDFLKKQSIASDNEKKKIVYTLQIGIAPYFPPLIASAIHNTPAGYEWHIRLHPRMSEEEVGRIKSELAALNTAAVYDIDAANALPLPIIMGQAHMHISRFSGSIAEADMQDVPYNIIIDNIGRQNFPEIVQQGRAHFIDPDATDFFEHIAQLSPNDVINTIDYTAQYNTLIQSITNTKAEI